MQYLALEQVGHSRQADVRMSPYIKTLIRFKVSLAHLIEENEKGRPHDAQHLAGPGEPWIRCRGQKVAV